MIPICSDVVALRPIFSELIFSMFDSEFKIAFLCGLILGISHIIVLSILYISKFLFLIVSRQKLIIFLLSKPLFFMSVSGKCSPMSPRPAAPK